jgi:hypothetical protein
MNIIKHKIKLLLLLSFILSLTYIFIIKICKTDPIIEEWTPFKESRRRRAMQSKKAGTFSKRGGDNQEYGKRFGAEMRRWSPMKKTRQEQRTMDRKQRNSEQLSAIMVGNKIISRRKKGIKNLARQKVKDNIDTISREYIEGHKKSPEEYRKIGESKARDGGKRWQQRAQSTIEDKKSTRGNWRRAGRKVTAMTRIGGYVDDPYTTIRREDGRIRRASYKFNEANAIHKEAKATHEEGKLRRANDRRHPTEGGTMRSRQIQSTAQKTPRDERDMRKAKINLEKARTDKETAIMDKNTRMSVPKGRLKKQIENDVENMINNSQECVWSNWAFDDDGWASGGTLSTAGRSQVQASINDGGFVPPTLTLEQQKDWLNDVGGLTYHDQEFLSKENLLKMDNIFIKKECQPKIDVLYTKYSSYNPRADMSSQEQQELLDNKINQEREKYFKKLKNNKKELEFYITKQTPDMDDNVREHIESILAEIREKHENNVCPAHEKWDIDFEKCVYTGDCPKFNIWRREDQKCGRMTKTEYNDDLEVQRRRGQKNCEPLEYYSLKHRECIRGDEWVAENERKKALARRRVDENERKKALARRRVEEYFHG